jgi:ABC-type sugar transport system substrate-binding protein
LVSSGIAGSARQGTSVALSADGNIAVVGGIADDGSFGAVSVFMRTAHQWMQDKELTGIGAVVKSASSLALSADGTLVAIGSPNDNGGIGAAWLFTRKGTGLVSHADR